MHILSPQKGETVQTVVKKLKDKEFYVYEYRLETPRYYEGFQKPATIGIGFIGPDTTEGMRVVKEILGEIRKNRAELERMFGDDAANMLILEFLRRFPADISLTIANETLSREDAIRYISANLLEEVTR
jgi:hypothetical protein